MLLGNKIKERVPIHTLPFHFPFRGRDTGYLRCRFRVENLVTWTERTHPARF